MGQALSGTKGPRKKNKHLLYGITAKGARNFVNRIGYNPHAFYERSDHDVITKDYGTHQTGYDFVVFLRKWMREQGYGHLSVVELLLWERQTKDVGFVNCFISHTHAEPISTTLSLAQHAGTRGFFPEGEPFFFFIDYFCARQCEVDFTVLEMVEVIEECGRTLASVPIDTGMQNLEPGCYFDRMLCLFEMFVTRETRGILKMHICGCGCSDSEALFCIMKTYFEGERIPIDILNAKYTEVEDQKRIVKYIKENGDAEHANSVIQDIMHEAAEGLDRYFISNVPHNHDELKSLDCEHYYTRAFVAADGDGDTPLNPHHPLKAVIDTLGQNDEIKSGLFKRRFAVSRRILQSVSSSGRLGSGSSLNKDSGSATRSVSFRPDPESIASADQRV